MLKIRTIVVNGKGRQLDIDRIKIISIQMMMTSMYQDADARQRDGIQTYVKLAETVAIWERHWDNLRNLRVLYWTRLQNLLRPHWLPLMDNLHRTASFWVELFPTFVIFPIKEVIIRCCIYSVPPTFKLMLCPYVLIQHSAIQCKQGDQQLSGKSEENKSFESNQWAPSIYIMIELCFFSLDQWEIRIHLLWVKCFNIPHHCDPHSNQTKFNDYSALDNCWCPW